MRKLRQNYNPNGRTRRKAGFHSESTAPAEYQDPFLNGDIPLCRLLNDAIEDVFPELRVQGKDSKGGGSQPFQTESGSILGQMIRRRYLLARKSFRTSLDTSFKKKNTNGDAWEFNKNNINFHSNNNTANNNATPPASTNTKKRRKRKKKKRNESDVSFLPTVITHESGESHFGSEPCSSSARNGMDSCVMSDGKSLMSTTDHSLEALDEAVKNEAEKLIELEANHEVPLLGSLPSDDDIEAQESPSQFIDQIKPQDETLFRALQDHTGPLPLTDGIERKTLLPSLEVDNIPENDNEDFLETKWKNPTRLSFLVSIEGANGHNRYRGNDSNARENSAVEGPKHLAKTISEKERTKIMFHEWMDQFFFVNDECECIETSIAKKDQNESDSQKGEWDSFLQFCNDRTVGKEKAVGIPFRELIHNASSIESRICREETIAEVYKFVIPVSSCEPRKSSRIVINPAILEKPSPQVDNDMDIDAAFDYVALEEGNHIPKTSNDEQEEEKSDSNISFIVTDAKISKLKKGNKKKNQTVDANVTPERYLYLEPLSSEQLEEFLSEWLIAGVDEERIVQMSIRNEGELSENEIDKITFPLVISEVELQGIKNRVIKTQISLKESLDNMNNELEKMRSGWRSKDAMTSIEKNLDFSGNNTMENCEESCHEYLTEDILPILIGEFSLPSHACADLQIHLWVVYLEALGKTLSACNSYYKRLEEDLADQNGKLPFIFTSAPFRKIYRELAEQKIDLLSEMGNSFSAASSSSATREFYARSSWEEHTRDTPNENAQKLDEDCRELIIELTEWTRIVNGGRMSAINKERSRRLLTVFNMLGVVVESLGEEYKMVEGYFSQKCQNYFSRLLSNIHLAHGVKDRMRLLEMDDVISLTTGIILMWRHVRIMRSRVVHSISADILPLSLQKWVLEASDIGCDSDKTSQLSPEFSHSKSWSGVGGKRRVMGILAGLTYVWLRERCKEWKAEKASQELLTYFDAELLPGDDPLPANAGNAKSSKKAKKKKNKKSSSLTDGSSNSNSVVNKPGHAEQILVGKSLEAIKQVPPGGGEIPISSDTISVAISEEKDKRDILNDGHRVEYEKEDNDSVEPGESLVVVQDESGCTVPAMEFLTNRLTELLRQTGKEKIVIISD